MLEKETTIRDSTIQQDLIRSTTTIERGHKISFELLGLARGKAKAINRVLRLHPQHEKHDGSTTEEPVLSLVEQTH